MKAPCGSCGNPTSMDAELLGPDEVAHHFECVADEPVDPRHLAQLLRRAGINPDTPESGDGSSPPGSTGGRPTTGGGSAQLEITEATAEAEAA